jgi:hypothetical protein
MKYKLLCKGIVEIIDHMLPKDGLVGRDHNDNRHSLKKRGAQKYKTAFFNDIVIPIEY